MLIFEFGRKSCEQTPNPSNKYGVLSVAQYYSHLGLTKKCDLLPTEAKPIFKKGRKTDVSNYQPISLLPILSKVIEKIVHKQTTKFLNNNNIFYKYQSGFKSNHSTDLFLSFPNDRILTMECILA